MMRVLCIYLTVLANPFVLSAPCPDKVDSSTYASSTEYQMFMYKSCDTCESVKCAIPYPSFLNQTVMISQEYTLPKFFPRIGHRTNDLLDFRADDMKECVNNRDCMTDKENKTAFGYCDIMATNHNIKVCYGSPFHRAVPTTNPDRLGLDFCDLHKDCYPKNTTVRTTIFCYIGANSSFELYKKEGTGEHHQGICVDDALAIKEGNNFTRHLSANLEECKSDRDCYHVTGYQGATCLKKHVNDMPFSYCIGIGKIIQGPACGKDKGVPSSPRKFCATNLDCNPFFNKSFDAPFTDWCHEGVCCNDPQHNLWLCPDRATQLFGEPRCANYNSSILNSGQCVDNKNSMFFSGGQCKNGHCCPQLDYSTPFYAFPEFTYLTNMRCTRDFIIPLPYILAFCDRETNRVGILGRRNFYGQPIKHRKHYCVTNNDCHSTEVCVQERRSLYFCATDPRIIQPKKFRFELEEQIFYTGKYAVLIVIFFSVLFYLISIRNRYLFNITWNDCENGDDREHEEYVKTLDEYLRNAVAWTIENKMKKEKTRLARVDALNLQQKQMIDDYVKGKSVEQIKPIDKKPPITKPADGPVKPKPVKEEKSKDTKDVKVKKA